MTNRAIREVQAFCVMLAAALLVVGAAVWISEVAIPAAQHYLEESEDHRQ